MDDRKAIIDCVKEYFKKCPYLDKLADVKVDYLDIESKDNEYWSIEKQEAPLILGKNVLGTKSHRQCQFVIATRTFFNPHKDAKNIENLHLFDNIAEWIYQNTKKGILPELNDDEIATKLSVETGGFLYGTNNSNTLARYEMKCTLLYDKKEESKIWH